MANSRKTDLFAVNNILTSNLHLLECLEKTTPENVYDREDIIESLRDGAGAYSSALEIYLSHFKKESQSV